jgi:hypothetical protein
VIFIAGAGAVFRFLCILPLTLRLQNRLPKQVRRRRVRRLPLKCRTCEGEKFERCGYVGAVSAKRLGADLEDAINDTSIKAGRARPPWQCLLCLRRRRENIHRSPGNADERGHVGSGAYRRNQYATRIANQGASGRRRERTDEDRPCPAGVRLASPVHPRPMSLRPSAAPAIRRLDRCHLLRHSHVICSA